MLQKSVTWFPVGEMWWKHRETDLEIRSFQKWEKCIMRMIKILATGKGSQYISEFPMENGESLYFEIKVQYGLENGNCWNRRNC